MDCPRNSPLESSLVEALKRRLVLSQISQREAERTLGMGHGTIGRILRGRASLRLCHLELLAPVLGFTLQEILAEALDETRSAEPELLQRQQ